MALFDREFDNLESELTRLRATNLALEAQVRPLERTVEQLKSQIEKLQSDAAAEHDEGLDDNAEKLLHAIANKDDGRFPEEAIGPFLRVNTAHANYYMAALRERGLINQVSYSPMAYGATPDGLAYLHRKGKL
jgi:hypothetical protein